MIRGRLLPVAGRAAQPERALLAAILVRAVKDAQGGCEDAAAWLAEEGAPLASLVFNIPPDVVRKWREAAAVRVHMIPAAKERYWRER